MLGRDMGCTEPARELTEEELPWDPARSMHHQGASAATADSSSDGGSYTRDEAGGEGAVAGDSRLEERGWNMMDYMSAPRSLPDDLSITPSYQDAYPAGRGWEVLSTDPGLSGLLRRLTEARETIDQQLEEKAAIMTLVQMLRVLLHWRTAAASSVHSFFNGQSLADQRARHSAARALQVPRSRNHRHGPGFHSF